MFIFIRVFLRIHYKGLNYDRIMTGKTVKRLLYAMVLVPSPWPNYPLILAKRPRPAADAAPLLQALKETKWDKAEVARRFGISRHTFYRKLRKAGLED